MCAWIYERDRRSFSFHMIVKKGETILDIAKMHKTTVENLAKSNKKIRELTLPVGTVLLIDKAK